MLINLRYNEDQLILQIAEGNENAFRQFFNHYYNRIFSVAFAFTKSAELAEEMVQDVFLKIWLKREGLPQVKKIEAYLFITARNHLYNELRKKIHDVTFVECVGEYFTESALSPENQLLYKDSLRLVNTAVEKLPLQQRAVFELSRNEGLNHDKIAQQLGISKLTVKSHLTKALQFIRQYLLRHSDTFLLLIFFAEKKIFKNIF